MESGNEKPEIFYKKCSLFVKIYFYQLYML